VNKNLKYDRIKVLIKVFKALSCLALIKWCLENALKIETLFLAPKRAPKALVFIWLGGLWPPCIQYAEYGSEANF